MFCFTCNHGLTQNSFPLVGSESMMFRRRCKLWVGLAIHLSLRGWRWIERRRGSRATQNLYSVGKIYIASALLYCRPLVDSVSAFRVKLGANDLNCVDVPLSPTHSLTHSLTVYAAALLCKTLVTTLVMFTAILVYSQWEINFRSDSNK